VTGPPPNPHRADTPYLSTGCFAEGRVVTGVLATSQTGGALTMLFAVTKPFTCPHLLQPGQAPQTTAVPLQGCFMMGKAQANLGMGRALGQLDVLSCVFPDRTALERPVKGYVTGVDGTLGLIGRVETRDSAVLARAGLASLLAGMSEALLAAKRTVVVTPFGGTTTTLNGNVGEIAGFGALANVSSQAAAFYLDQARQLLPVIWVESGTPARLVLQEGLSLDGYPTQVAMVSRSRPY